MTRSIVALFAVVSLVAATPAMGRALGEATPSPARYQLKRLKPPIVWKRIPYGHRRRRQMAAYSNRHYGKWSWHLSDPKVIVEHYTDGLSWQGAWNTFAANTKHNGEYPGTCAHFLIDRNGTIRQLVPLDIRCRHAVGMNYTAIGIEHVGTSDHMVLSDRKQMRSSLRLTMYLMARFGINIGNVIGHRETLDSPYHRELYPSWRCLVHADFPHWAMHKYRRRLRPVLSAHGVKAGKGPVWVDSGC